MSTGTILMMVLGCGAVWGGVVVASIYALAVEKKNKLQEKAD